MSAAACRRALLICLAAEHGCRWKVPDMLGSAAPELTPAAAPAPAPQLWLVVKSSVAHCTQKYVPPDGHRRSGGCRRTSTSCSAWRSRAMALAPGVARARWMPPPPRAGRGLRRSQGRAGERAQA
jgi:hypothetical protein